MENFNMGETTNKQEQNLKSNISRNRGVKDRVIRLPGLFPVRSGFRV